MTSILCSGPGPHVPASGILGQSSQPLTGLLCPSTACQAASVAAAAAGQIIAANQDTLTAKAQAALTANGNDTTQDATIQSGAATIQGTAGPFTLAQCTTFIKQLAQAVNTLAGNDVNSKKELTAVIRLVLGQFDSTSGT